MLLTSRFAPVVFPMAFAVPTAVSAQALGFKGVNFGQSKQELLAAFPNLTCTSEGRAFFLGEEICKAAPLALSGCDARCAEGKEKLKQYAGAFIADPMFLIVAGKFEGFSFSIATQKYTQVKSALAANYPTGKESFRTMRQGNGSKLQSRQWTVSIRGSSLTVSEHSGSVNMGAVYSESAALTKWRKAEKQGNVSKNKNDI